MAVSIKELIQQKEKIERKKQDKFDLETSIGVITVKQPTRSFVAETLALSEGEDEYMILECVVEPKLKDRELQEAYECTEPTDIVGKLFLPGEMTAIATKIVQCAGYRKEIRAELHKMAKN